MRNSMDLNRATALTPDVEAAIDDKFAYHAPDEAQIAAMSNVRDACARTVKVILANVAPGPDRTVAFRKIAEARMDANSAIIHGGTAARVTAGAVTLGGAR